MAAESLRLLGRANLYTAASGARLRLTILHVSLQDILIVHVLLLWPIAFTDGLVVLDLTTTSLHHVSEARHRSRGIAETVAQDPDVFEDEGLRLVLVSVLHLALNEVLAKSGHLGARVSDVWAYSLRLLRLLAERSLRLLHAKAGALWLLSERGGGAQTLRSATKEPT